jgi:hypothetical protein
MDLSQAPLSTGASLPLLTVTPPLESRYGGLAKTLSTLPEGIVLMRFTQSAWVDNRPRLAERLQAPYSTPPF